MHRNSTTLVFAMIGISICCFSTSAQARYQGPVEPRCPAGYWLLEPVCINQGSGDVVNASPAAASSAALNAGCAPDYWRLADLCLNSSTGDVELVDEKEWPAGQRAEARN